MSIVIVTTGDEPLLKEATKYVEALGVPRHLIRSADMHAKVGDAMTLTVTMYVDRDMFEQAQVT